MFIKDIRPLYSCNDSTQAFLGRSLMKAMWIVEKGPSTVMGTCRRPVFRAFLRFCLQKPGLIEQHEVREIKGIPYEAVLDGHAVAEF